MILTLEVTGELAAELGAGGRKVFNAIGGTIGRLPDNDWVFPDPYVSGRHALIRYLNGKYFVEDTSTNGVFVNSPDQRLSRTQAHQLRHGDVLFIDAYRIKVSIENDPDARDSKDPFASLRSPPPKAPPRRAPEPPPPPAEDRTASLVRRDLDDGDAGDDSADNGTQWFGSSEMSPPKRSAPPPPREVPPPPPRPKPRVEAGSSGDVNLRVFLEAAGIEG